MNENANDFQELLSIANLNIAFAEKETEIRLARELEDKKIATESLSLYIQKLIIEVLLNAKKRNGTIDDLSQFSKYGAPINASWTLNESMLQIVIDFSWARGDDTLFYDQGGFNTRIINWNYLCEMLHEKGITIEHKEESSYKPEDTEYPWYGGTHHYNDLLIITLAKTKKYYYRRNIKK